MAQLHDIPRLVGEFFELAKAYLLVDETDMVDVHRALVGSRRTMPASAC